MLAAAAALSFAPLAHAQDVMPREHLLKRLETGYGEVPVARGLANNGMIMEVLAGPDGTWTIILTTPHGVTRLMMAGEIWRILPVEPPGEDS